MVQIYVRFRLGGKMQIWRHVTDLAPDSYPVTLNAQPTSPQSLRTPDSISGHSPPQNPSECSASSALSWVLASWRVTGILHLWWVLWVPGTAIRFKAIGSWSLSASKVARCLYASRIHLRWALIYVPACIWTVQVRQSWWQQSAQSHTDCVLQVNTLHINSTLKFNPDSRMLSVKLSLLHLLFVCRTQHVTELENPHLAFSWKLITHRYICSSQTMVLAQPCLPCPTLAVSTESVSCLLSSFNYIWDCNPLLLTVTSACSYRLVREIFVVYYTCVASCI